MIGAKLWILIFLCLASVVVAPPVSAPVKEKDDDDDDGGVSQLLYQKYLQEVVNALEDDPEFRKKLESANSSHIRSHEFASELDLVSHNIREKLDEVKRLEVKRLNDLKHKQDSIENGNDHAGHMDITNTETFEVEDLKKLIHKATSDLEDIDKKRRDEFKNYEMRKEHGRRAEMKKMDEEHRKKAEKEHEEQVAKHKDHPKLHHPGSKPQFEDVWEKEDGLDREDFDAKTFFIKHDLDGDGYLNEEEIEALFQLELSKMYEANHTEDDMVERYEEMSRMREHLVNQVDENKDKLISRKEYDAYVNSKEFLKDEGWKGLEEEEPYEDEEFEEYEKRLSEEEQMAEHDQIQVPDNEDHVKQMEAKDMNQPDPAAQHH